MIYTADGLLSELEPNLNVLKFDMQMDRLVGLVLPESLRHEKSIDEGITHSVKHVVIHALTMDFTNSTYDNVTAYMDSLKNTREFSIQVFLILLKSEQTMNIKKKTKSYAYHVLEMCVSIAPGYTGGSLRVYMNTFVNNNPPKVVDDDDDDDEVKLVTPKRTATKKRKLSELFTDADFQVTRKQDNSQTALIQKLQDENKDMLERITELEQTWIDFHGRFKVFQQSINDNFKN